jgi:fimbrial chaperone protein
MKVLMGTLLFIAANAIVIPSVKAEGFGINATRLIYPQGAKSIAVTLRNTMPAVPYLVQANISLSVDGNEKTPFWLTPPIFRLEPNSTNQLRIALNNPHLPLDRESVFYLNTRAIPASQKGPAGAATPNVSGAIQLGVGTIIKMFYRPGGLPGTAAEAQSGLKFSASARGLKVSNPSPYFVSLAGLTFNGKVLPLQTPEALMIAPFGSHTYPASQAKGKVAWKTINDQGGIDGFEHQLP